MKIRTFFLMILLTPLYLFAQESGAIKKGGMEVNAGLGIWSNSPTIIPLHGGMDFGISDDISLGFDVEWRLYKTLGWSHNVFVLQARGDYHFNKLIELDNKWDVYVGLQLGPAFVTAASDYTGSIKGFNFAVDGIVGGRWFFSGNTGLNAEIGLMGVFPDISRPPSVFLNVGVTFRIK